MNAVLSIFLLTYCVSFNTLLSFFRVGKVFNIYEINLFIYGLWDLYLNKDILPSLLSEGYKKSFFYFPVVFKSTKCSFILVVCIILNSCDKGAYLHVFPNVQPIVSDQSKIVHFNPNDVRYHLSKIQKFIILDSLSGQSYLPISAPVRFLGWEDPLEKEMATYSSVLAWEIPWTEETGRLQSMGSQSWT